MDTVKIDGSFLRNLAESREQRIFLRELTDLIKGFGFAIVAEGVESAEDALLAMEAGVGYLQGYHLGPPTMERAWLARDSAPVAGAGRATIRETRNAPVRRAGAGCASD